MEIIEKIQLNFNDLDEERSLSIARTCAEMMVPFKLNLVFCKDDQMKLEIIQSKQKEVQEKIKEMGIKAHYAADLYNQHLNIELDKVFNDQAFNLPLKPDETSIFKVEKVQSGDSEDNYNKVDHVEFALINAQKAGEESILWTVFYSELEDLEMELIEEMEDDKKKELAESTSSIKEPEVEIKIKKLDVNGLPVKETNLSSKYLQIFKKRGYELFCYLQMEYTLDDHSPVAKYSYIYHFLSYEELIIARSQSKYMEFIKVAFGVNMSKILPENDKFNDDIHLLLSRLKSNYEKKSQSE